MADNEAESADKQLLQTHTTGEDRVRMVARQLTEPHTANWVANEADWSHEPTQRVLERLVDDGIMRRDTSGSHTTYYPDYRQQAVKEVVRLRDSAVSVEKLTKKISDMKETIREWEDEFGVDSPNQLRATVATDDLTPTEEANRREIARRWEHLRRRIEIAGFAVREWDFLAPNAESAEAGP